MLRTYLGPPGKEKTIRLNIWDKRFAVPNVSVIHDHPWDFHSQIVAGAFCNIQYAELRTAYPSDPKFHYTTIKTGVGGGLTKEPKKEIALRACAPELYGPGDTYSQLAHEVHESVPVDGTVTINQRTGDTECARVFWPYLTEWVDAIPRPATFDEIMKAATHSLQRWF